MYIKEDYSYIKNIETKMIEMGYGEKSVHSIYFDRYFTEDQKMENMQQAKEMSLDEWNKSCDEFSKLLERYMEKILNVFLEKYDIHQVSEETSTIEHFRRNWDLHFYTSKGWDNKEYMDSFILTFNHRRSAKENMELLQEIIALVLPMEYKNVYCRVQYSVAVDREKVVKDARVICEKLENQFITYRGNVGKIKLVAEANGIRRYGFFKKGSKKRYFDISYEEILAMYGSN